MLERFHRVFPGIWIPAIGFCAIDAPRAQFVESEIVFPVQIDSHAVVSDLSGTNTVMLTGRSDAGEKRLGLFEIRDDGSAAHTPATDFALPDDVLFYDTGEIAGETAILFLTPRGVSRFDFAELTIQPLLDVSSIYRAPSQDGVIEHKFLMDLNGDGLEDLVLADFSGFHVAFQRQGGFSAVTTLTLAPRLRLANGQSEYLADRIHYYDFDLDGSGDLAVLRDNGFLVFKSDATGFSSSATQFPIDIELASDSSQSLFGPGVNSVDQSNLRVSRISSIADLNDDALPDVITLTAISSGLFDKRSTYHVHLGKRGTAGVFYSPVPDSELPSDGFQVNLATVDVEGDGRQDLVSTSFELGFSQLLSALFTRAINLEVALYRMDSAYLFHSEPDFRTQVRLQFSLSTGFVHGPAVRFADFDGDRKLDLLLQDGEQRLLIHRGTGDSRRFDRDIVEWSTQLPRDGRLIDTVDANGDGARDLLVGYGPADGDLLRNRIRLLVSSLEPPQ